jgi:transcription elongation GreA/GreB family factor
MAISRDTQGFLAKGDFDALEDAWLARSAADPADLDYFVGAARALVGVGEEDRSRLLLELLDEQLRQRQAWSERLALLRRVGPLWVPPERLHGEILATLERVHPQSPSFAGLAEIVGLHRAPDDIPKTWEKLDRLVSLLAFDRGSIVWMEGKGAGRVVEVNLGLESFKVDFERHSGLLVGFRAATKLLKPLPPGHVLRIKIEDPDALRDLRDRAPAELLRVVLESLGRPLSAAEIREALLGVVSESEWASWWSAARRHPQVVSSSGGRQTYSWATSGARATEAVWRAFAAAPLGERLELLRRAADRDPELRARMTASLAAGAAAAAEEEPGLAFEIWFALERSGGAPADVAWSPERLLAEGRDLRLLIGGIRDRLLRERAYSMLRERREDWPQLFADFLRREEDPRALSALADGLRGPRPEEVERFADQLLAQPRKAPAAFVWLAERAATDAAIRERNPLRLLQQILTALQADEFAAHRPRLKPLADSGGTLPRLLSQLTAEQAPLAEEAIHRAAGLEAYQREPLLNALHLRFPALQPQRESALYATAESIAERRAELERLLQVEIPANRKAIEEARALGDLRENFEYKSARQRHEYLAARIAALDADLRRARPLDPALIEASEVRIGTRVALAGTDGARTLTILGPWESKPEAGVVSYESDAAKALLGRKPGETVELEGRTLTVDRIEPFR